MNKGNERGESSNEMDARSQESHVPSPATRAKTWSSYFDCSSLTQGLHSPSHRNIPITQSCIIAFPRYLAPSSLNSQWPASKGPTMSHSPFRIPWMAWQAKWWVQVINHPRIRSACVAIPPAFEFRSIICTSSFCSSRPVSQVQG